MVYTVYILFSFKYNKIYVGYTSDLINRFHSHNELGNKDWTRSFRPWIVIYCEYFANKAQAEKREKQLKGGKGREWIWNKIKKELDSNGFISA
jgi:putative endonuclease